MTLTLEVTGEAVADGGNLTTLILDDKNMIGMEYEALRTIIGQVVNAINALGKKANELKDTDEQIADAVQHLEQQISSFEVRSRECEDTCQEIRLQLGTMAEAQKIPEKEELEVRSEVTRKDLNEMVQKVDVLHREMETAQRAQESEIESQHRKFEHLEETLDRHQEFFDDELDNRLTQNDDDHAVIKADIDALRQSMEEMNSRKASKVEMGDIAHRVHTLDEGQTANQQKLTDASKQFEKLDGLTDLVAENQKRIQEMWALFGKESQELREWASAGFVELRSGVRSKMSEQEALSHVTDLRKEVRELAPFLSEAMSRMEANVRQKAEASEVQRLQDDMEVLNRTTGRPKQLLVGTKCLACDRQVSTADATDQGPVSLVDRRQEGELWNEVQRAIDKNAKDDGRQPGTKDVLKYVAIHVGTPARAGIFEGRDNRDPSPGGHFLLRMGGGVQSRPQTHAGSESDVRSPPREPTPLVRVAPRRPAPPGRFAAGPVVPTTPRDGPRRLPNTGTTVRAALGGGAPMGPPPSAAPGSQPGARASLTTLSNELPYAPVRMQPAAQSGMHQPQATEYDAYISDGGQSTPGHSRPLTPAS